MQKETELLQAGIEEALVENQTKEISLQGAEAKRLVERVTELLSRTNPDSPKGAAFTDMISKKPEGKVSTLSDAIYYTFRGTSYRIQ